MSTFKKRLEVTKANNSLYMLHYYELHIPESIKTQML